MNEQAPEMNGWESFDPLSIPLSGTRLIEASAGTGKTYNIANFFLRLVLGHGCEARKVDEILVVTFTRAATAELKGRIRERIEQAYQDFRRNLSNDDFIEGLMKDSDEGRLESIQLLRAALLSMDEASISTIHGFAVKAVRTFLFETGSIADIEISETGNANDIRIVNDVYRRLSAMPGDVAADFIRQVSDKSHKDFQRYFGAEFSAGARLIPDADEAPGIDELYRFFVRRRDAITADHAVLSRKWNDLFESTGKKDSEYFGSIESAFNLDLDTDAPAEYRLSGKSRGLANYLDQQLSGPSIDYDDKSGTGYYRKWMNTPEHAGRGEHFDFLMQLRRHFRAYFELQDQLRRTGPAALAREIINGREIFSLEEMSADDVIHLINQKLEDPGTAQSLRQIITQTYPVCLVDEFQDTDPAQFNMFRQIYSDAGPDTGFLMIGDPKQSIYAFRGADIFSYLRVRENVKNQQAEEGEQKIFSLAVNWRSTALLVAAANALFREPGQSAEKESGPVFIFPGIEYQEVRSCERTHDEDRGSYNAGGQLSSKPLVFVGNPESGPEDNIAKDRLLRRYASDTASRVSALLDSEDGGRVSFADGSVAPVKPGDIAVLVRNGQEARQVREQLAKPEIGIRAVYLSQRDSVFSDAEISEDLYHVLLAFNEYADKRRLKTALATPLLRGFGFDFSSVRRLDEDDNFLEKSIEQFAAYAKLWNERGILTALGRLYQDQGLFDAIAARPDSDRIFTDLRHLGDLLQQQDLQCSSAEQLIDWYARQLNDDSQLDEDSKRIRLESDEELVKIVTIHISKGLQYPVVFLPFFFLPRPVDLKKDLPLYHDEDDDFTATYDFSSDQSAVKQRMQKERLAEDIRFLYVAITRAVYQCHIGISASTLRSSAVFDLTPWAHLLGISSARPQWSEIKAALEQRLPGEFAAFAEAGDTGGRRFRHAGQQLTTLEPPAEVESPVSSWQVTSYSKLAHTGAEFRIDNKGDDEQSATGQEQEVGPDPRIQADEERWKSDIRYSLKGSALTGDCLHNIFEQHALNPQGDFGALVEKMLFRFGLDKPPVNWRESNGPEDERRAMWISAVRDWLEKSMEQPLSSGASGCRLSLHDLFQQGQFMPELTFDFSIGSNEDASDVPEINDALALEETAGIALAGNRIHGLMTGAIDLTFIHDDKVYLLDYKSNTLGRNPAHYDHAGMTDCMKSSRYDLQYLIYSTAVHRYFSTRFAQAYAFDPAPGRELSFGGVFYLFLRGMGIIEEAYARHGVWFRRPGFETVHALDRALRPSPERTDHDG